MRNRIIEEDLARITSTSLNWAEFAGRTVLISGANGFLPAYMVETLLHLNEQGLFAPAKVIALVRNREKAEARFAHYRGRDDLEFRVQDVCEPAGVDGPVDYVIHAASQASPKYYGIDPVGTLSANVLGTHNLLKLAREKRARGFLFFSSGEVYGAVESSRIPMKEDAYGILDPTDVRSCYGESKRVGETMCVSWAHQYQVPARIVRPFHTYGPGMRLDDGRVFADFVSDIVNNRDIMMKSDGAAVRAFCYLADAVAGFFTVLLKGKVGQAYNVGNDRAEVSIRDLAQILVGLFPEKRLRVIQQSGAEPAGYLKSPVTRTCPDISKARLLGWEPTTPVEEGFRRTIWSFA
jgi:UDP-glucuronate decarboxylase